MGPKALSVLEFQQKQMEAEVEASRAERRSRYITNAFVYDDDDRRSKGPGVPRPGSTPDKPAFSMLPHGSCPPSKKPDKSMTHFTAAFEPDQFNLETLPKDPGSTVLNKTHRLFTPCPTMGYECSVLGRVDGGARTDAFTRSRPLLRSSSLSIEYINPRHGGEWKRVGKSSLPKHGCFSRPLYGLEPL